MVSSLDVVIEISELFETTGYEGSLVSEIFDTEIFPMLKTPLHESDMVTVGDRLANAIDRVRTHLNRQSGDRFRMLMDMMKSALLTYVRTSHDTLTGRAIWSRGLKAGSDVMMTITGATVLANALYKQHPDQAKHLLKGIAGKLSGAQVAENASCAAVSVGAIATVPNGKKKKRKDSLFAESLSWDDLQGKSDTIRKLAELVDLAQNKVIGDVIVDPVTAELVLVLHESLAPVKQREYESKSIQEMIDIAFRAVQRGLIQVEIEEREV